MDRALGHALAAVGTKRWLFLLLLLKYVLRMRPMGNFGAKTIIRQAEEGEWEAMNPHYLRDVIARDIAGHPQTVCEKLRGQINRGVLSNGQANHVCRLDVFEFLGSVEGDILYLDPPYAGTSAYETALRPLDSMLEGKIVESEPSVFSRRGAIEALERLFDASRKFPIWVVSYGNAEIDLDTLTRLVGEFRPVAVAEAFRYTHLTGLSGDEHRDKNREFLIVAKERK